jgi:hypothetical protein
MACPPRSIAITTVPMRMVRFNGMVITVSGPYCAAARAVRHEVTKSRRSVNLLAF